MVLSNNRRASLVRTFIIKVSSLGLISVIVLKLTYVNCRKYFFLPSNNTNAITTVTNTRSTPLDLPFDCPMCNNTTRPMKMRLAWVILLYRTDNLWFHNQILFLDPKGVC